MTPRRLLLWPRRLILASHPQPGLQLPELGRSERLARQEPAHAPPPDPKIQHDQARIDTRIRGKLRSRTAGIPFQHRPPRIAVPNDPAQPAMGAGYARQCRGESAQGEQRQDGSKPRRTPCDPGKGGRKQVQDQRCCRQAWLIARLNAEG